MLSFQLKDAIQEASKQGSQQKVFGGGTKELKEGKTRRQERWEAKQVNVNCLLRWMKMWRCKALFKWQADWTVNMNSLPS